MQPFLGIDESPNKRENKVGFNDNEFGSSDFLLDASKRAPVPVGRPRMFYDNGAGISEQV